jgi:hypothetical protein
MIICKLSMKKICHKATCSQTYANLLHRSQQKLSYVVKNMILPTILGVQSILIILIVISLKLTYTHTQNSQ